MSNKRPEGLLEPISLPGAAVLKNRLAKAAMSEGLADSLKRVTDKHLRLYGDGVRNSYGLMIAGNVQIDRRFLERPGNIAIDCNGGLSKLAELARICKAGDAHIWMEINHSGLQTPFAIHPQPLSPSAISLPSDMAGYGQAQELSKSGIKDII